MADSSLETQLQRLVKEYELALGPLPPYEHWRLFIRTPDLFLDADLLQHFLRKERGLPWYFIGLLSRWALDHDEQRVWLWISRVQLDVDKHVQLTYKGACHSWYPRVVDM